MNSHPHDAEKQLRAFLKQRSLVLSTMTLPQAWEVMKGFWFGVKFSGIVEPEGDALAAYEDVTDHGRGTRLELGIVRVLRLHPEAGEELKWPALRLRLRLCYKWDMDVVRDVLPAGTWSYACWHEGQFDSFQDAVLATPGYRTMAGKKPAEARIAMDSLLRWGAGVRKAGAVT